MTELDPKLHALGDRLERAATADLAAAAQPVAVRRPRRISGRVAMVVAVLAIGVTGVAIAADQLVSSNDVAQSMPAGTLALAGTQPTCTVVTKDVEFHCVLAGTPSDAISDWKGTVEPTVDASKHVNGGCRSLARDGREWQCYIGQAAVDQKIIAQSFLGEYAPTPGVG
jgi:hypothetical protein